MFEREHHRRVAAILEALDGDFLRAHHCLFGGGTAIALKYGEYRESIDVDFLVSDVTKYRALRERLSGRAGVDAIARVPGVLKQTRDVRADQYGIRTLLEIQSVVIKFEIVLEGRISLDDSDHEICGIATLSTIDMAASKLLANSDRWADDSVHSRDVIDLAMMDLDRKTFDKALKKARSAYGSSVDKDLKKAIERLRARRGRLTECIEALQMTLPPAVVWKHIRRLLPR